MYVRLNGTEWKGSRIQSMVSATICNLIQNENMKESSSYILYACFLTNHTIYLSSLSSFVLVVRQFLSIQFMQIGKTKKIHLKSVRGFFLENMCFSLFTNTVILVYKLLKSLS